MEGLKDEIEIYSLFIIFEVVLLCLKFFLFGVVYFFNFFNFVDLFVILNGILEYGDLWYKLRIVVNFLYSLDLDFYFC